MKEAIKLTQYYFQTSTRSINTINIERNQSTCQKQNPLQSISKDIQRILLSIILELDIQLKIYRYSNNLINMINNASKSIDMIILCCDYLFYMSYMY